MKDLRVSKIVKKIKLKRLWGELESKVGFQELSAKFYFGIFSFIKS